MKLNYNVLILIIYKGGEKILRQYLLRLGLFGALTFLVFFIYYYKTSGKFRQSIISAFAALTVLVSSLTPARATGEADAFTPQPQHQSRLERGRGSFGHNSNNDGSGPGKPNGDDSDGDDVGIPKYPKTESIEETESHLSNIDELINKLEEISDSDSETEENQCSIDEQNKAGIDELPDSSEFIYNLETKTARKALKKVWKNFEAKKEVLAGLDKMNNGELLPRNQKTFKGFKTLKELKFTKTRMLVQPGINDGPDQIVAIFMRRDLDNIASNFKGKYK